MVSNWLGSRVLEGSLYEPIPTGYCVWRSWLLWMWSMIQTASYPTSSAIRVDSFSRSAELAGPDAGTRAPNVTFWSLTLRLLGVGLRPPHCLLAGFEGRSDLDLGAGPPWGVYTPC